MIDEMPCVRPILTNGVELPKMPKANLLDWIWFYIFNWTRKPLVLIRQRELREIEVKVFWSLNQTIRQLLANKCKDCAAAYETLRPQIFLSQVKFMCRRLNCDEHPELINAFLKRHAGDFKRAEAIAKWINGF